MTVAELPSFSSPSPMRYERVMEQPENPFFQLIDSQNVAIIPEFTLESGVTLYSAPIAYKTWGRLNAARDNVMVICHALTGSADVEDWWGPLIGPGKAFDPKRFFIVCCNSLGSPYGTASPCTLNPETGTRYGPEFPLTTIRDDVNLHKLVLDDLGVRQIAVAIGGSMGGMLVLEWAYFGKDYVRAIIPLATSSRHSAWCISWGEAQRQAVYSDPKYDDGYYPFEDSPNAGLGAARMSALLTYRSRNSFESRFGRNVPDPTRKPYLNNRLRSPSTASEEHWAVHNDGFKNGKKLSAPATPNNESTDFFKGGNGNESGDTSPYTSTQPSKPARPRAPTYFSAQSYLRYQSVKFVQRFDPNCYIAITRKLDTHDVSRLRASTVSDALSMIEQPTLVIGIESDGLFTFDEQRELASSIPRARLAKIESPEGHDAFLLEFKQVNEHILGFLEEVLPEFVNVEVVEEEEEEEGLIDEREIRDGEGRVNGGEKTQRKGLVTEVDDITAW